MRYVLLDLSNGAPTRDGGVLTPALLEQMAEAYTIQLNRDYSAEYGGNFSVRAGSGAGDQQDGENPFAFISSNDAAPDAIAWHQSNGNGLPLLFDAVSASDTLNGPGNSVTVSGSHENLEASEDAPCNIWCDTGEGSGIEVAREVADPLENQSYPVTISSGVTIWVSDFALKAFFAAGAMGPYSFSVSRGLGGLDAPAPFSVANGLGYMIQRRYDPTSEQAVQGRRIEVVGTMRRRPAMHKWARKYRRGIRT